MPQHFSLNLDDFCEAAFHHLGRNQDGGASHYARFTAETKEQAIDRAMASLHKLVEEKIYPSDDYGYGVEA